MVNTRIIEALDNAYITMLEYDYDAYSQFLGYMLSGDVAYITNKNNARLKLMEFERDEVMEMLLQVFFEEQPLNEYSGTSYKAAKNLLFVFQAMMDAGYNPIRQIVGFLVTDDASYVSVKNGARAKISENTVKDYCDVLIRAFISSRRGVY